MLALAVIAGSGCATESEGPPVRLSYEETLVDYVIDGDSVRCIDADAVQASPEYAVCVWRCGWYDDAPEGVLMEGEDPIGAWRLAFRVRTSGAELDDVVLMDDEDPQADCN